MHESHRPTAVVTGASRGIGRAIALRLAKDHHIVALARSADDLEKFVEVNGRKDAVDTIMANRHLIVHGKNSCAHAGVSSSNPRAALMPSSRAASCRGVATLHAMTLWFMMSPTTRTLWVCECSFGRVRVVTSRGFAENAGLLRSKRIPRRRTPRGVAEREPRSGLPCRSFCVVLLQRPHGEARGGIDPGLRRWWSGPSVGSHCSRCSFWSFRTSRSTPRCC